MTKFINSIWFALISGLASVISVVLTLYQLKLKNQPQSKFRSKEWIKTFVLSIGIGIMIFGGIRFYTDFPPPNIQLFRNIFDFLHGYNSSIWENKVYSFNASFQKKNHTIDIYEIYINKTETILYFNIKKNSDSTDIQINDLFPKPAIGTTKGIRYQLISKVLKQNGNNVLSGLLFFPSLINQTGEILFWDNYTDVQNRLNENATFSFSCDNRGEGTPMWGILFMTGFILFIVGLMTDTITELKHEIIYEFNDLMRKQDIELNDILKGRKYEDLSYHEKQKYDQVLDFYKKIQNELLKVFVGEKPPTKES